LARIWDTKDHSAGESFNLSKSPRTDIKKYFKSLSGPFITVSESDYKKEKTKIEHSLAKPNSKNHVYFTSNNKFYKLTLDENTQGSFVWVSEKGKTNTDILTKVKELVSLWVILNNNSEDEVISKLRSTDPKYVDFYNSKFYESAKEQKRVLKSKYSPTPSYHGERQNDDLSKIIYTKMKKIERLHFDNWNPADIWFFNITADKIKKDIDHFVTIQELNNYIIEQMESKNILPVSLKQTSAGKGKFEYVSSKNAANIDIDLDAVSIDLSESFNNFIINTKSNFQIRVGFKSGATSLSVFFEGRMKNAGYQLGAVDKKVIQKVLGFKDAQKRVPELSFVESILRKIKFPLKSASFSTKEQYIQAFEKFDDFQKTRAYNILLALEAFNSNYNYDLMKLCYLSARKMTDKASDYLILK